jgi:hypothetical protein
LHLGLPQKRTQFYDGCCFFCHRRKVQERG